MEAKVERLEEEWYAEEVWLWVEMDFFNIEHQSVDSVALEGVESMSLLIEGEELIFINAKSLDQNAFTLLVPVVSFYEGFSFRSQFPALNSIVGIVN